MMKTLILSLLTVSAASGVFGEAVTLPETNPLLCVSRESDLVFRGHNYLFSWKEPLTPELSREAAKEYCHLRFVKRCTSNIAS